MESIKKKVLVRNNVPLELSFLRKDLRSVVLREACAEVVRKKTKYVTANMIRRIAKRHSCHSGGGDKDVNIKSVLHTLVNQVVSQNKDGDSYQSLLNSVLVNYEDGDTGDAPRTMTFISKCTDRITLVKSGINSLVESYKPAFWKPKSKIQQYQSACQTVFTSVVDAQIAKIINSMPFTMSGDDTNIFVRHMQNIINEKTADVLALLNEHIRNLFETYVAKKRNNSPGNRYWQ